MAHEKIYVRPLVPRYLHDFTAAIIGALPDGADMLPIHHAKVSLIFDPYEIKDLLPGRRAGDFAFEGSIDLLLVSGAPERRPIAAFDIYRGAQAPFHQEKRCFFDGVGLFYFACDKTSWRSSILTIHALYANHASDTWTASPIINPAQWDVMRRLADSASELNLYLLHEVSLDSVIAVDSGDKSPLGVYPMNFLDREYLRKTSFDAVIATAPPNCKPVCAIEFDGRVHDDPSKQAKDDKKNLACSEARLPLIRIPSGDVKAANVGRTVIEVQQHAQLKRAEASWLVVEELLKALAKAHFSSTWYLSQLHYFLSLEADAISELDPDSSSTLRDYANELWTLAEGKICSLEAQAAGLIEESIERRTWNEWLHEYHSTEYDLAQEDLSRIGVRVEELCRRLKSDYEDCVLKGASGIRLLKLYFEKRAVPGPRNASTYSLRLEGNDLLNALGVTIRPRVVELGPIGISVSGDALGVTPKLVDEVAFRYLLRSAGDILSTYKTKIARAVDDGKTLLKQHVAADVWSRIPIALVESEIQRSLETAVRKTEPDFSNASKQQVLDWLDLKPGAIPMRDVSPAAREERLAQAVWDCHETVNRTEIAREQKNALAAFIDRVSSELSGNLSHAGH